jgi:hypothetical protein
VAQFSYTADGEVLRKFFASEAFVRALRGPVGSGKSVACCAEIFRRSLAQKKAPDGIRKTRWAVIRNTAPELRTTTIKTWLDWFPEHTFGKFNWQPPFTHRIRRGELDIEVIFIALDKPEDVKKLLSLELTGAWANEARELPKAIIDAMTMRVGRFPSERDGGPTWSGVILDTNAPDEDHWWPIMAGDVPLPDWLTEQEARQMVKPANWEFYTQPGAMKPVKDKDGGIAGYEMNPKRENQKGIKPSYYQNMIGGKTTNWVNVYVCNKYGSITDGKPIYPHFDRMLHVAADALQAVQGIPIHMGIDFGLTPAAVFGQNVRGRWLILKEIVAQDMGIVRFSEILRREMMMYQPATYSVWGDPAGDIRAQTDEDTPFKVLRHAGIQARPTETNDIALRIESVQSPLTRLIDKTPGLLIDPRCTNLIKGFEGGYHYRRMQVTGERYEETPNKNRFSHVHDALQYMMLGGGEGRALLRPSQGTNAVTKPRNWDVFNRKPKEQKRGFLKGW